jgi:hypothetical protein
MMASPRLMQLRFGDMSVIVPEMGSRSGIGDKKFLENS